MKKLHCTEPACKNWILTGPDMEQARARGWTYWPETGHARCPNDHYSPRTATVGEIRAALRGLPAGQVVVLSDCFGHSGSSTEDLVAAGKRARNLQNFPEPTKGP